MKGNVTASTVKAGSPLSSFRVRRGRGSIFAQPKGNGEYSARRSVGEKDSGAAMATTSSEDSIPPLAHSDLQDSAITIDGKKVASDRGQPTTALATAGLAQDGGQEQATPLVAMIEESSAFDEKELASRALVLPKSPVARAANRVAKEAFGSARKAFNSMLSSEDSVMRAHCIEMLATDVEYEARAKTHGARLVAKAGIGSLEGRLRGTTMEEQAEYDTTDPFALSTIAADRGHFLGNPFYAATTGAAMKGRGQEHYEDEGNMKKKRSRKKGRETRKRNEANVEVLDKPITNEDNQVEEEEQEKVMQLSLLGGGIKDYGSRRLHIHVRKSRHGVEARQSSSKEIENISESTSLDISNGRKSSVFSFAAEAVKRKVQREEDRTRLARRTSLDIAGAHVRSVSNELEIEFPLGLGEEDNEREFREHKKKLRPWK